MTTHNESIQAIIDLPLELRNKTTVVFFTTEEGMHSKGVARYCRDNYHAMNTALYTQAGLNLYAIPAFDRDWKLLETLDIVEELNDLFYHIEEEVRHFFLITRLEDVVPKLTVETSIIEKLFEDYNTLDNVMFTPSYKKILIPEIIPPIVNL